MSAMRFARKTQSFGFTIASNSQIPARLQRLPGLTAWGNTEQSALNTNSHWLQGGLFFQLSACEVTPREHGQLGVHWGLTRLEAWDTSRQRRSGASRLPIVFAHFPVDSYLPPRLYPATLPQPGSGDAGSRVSATPIVV
ncbi:hypothetical protein B0H10DRAFT_1964157 [Mycena sp. CBHHK59/15]|nr:hypothetical protein B0H10DRAFT_1964157 [Mycena sp. CBHHK59/15]